MANPLYKKIRGRELGIWLFSVGFPLPFLLAGIWLLGLFGSAHRTASVSQGWVEEKATVELSVYIPPAIGRLATHRIVYSFTREETSCRASRVVPGLSGGGESLAWVERYKEGQEIVARVHPRDPGQSVLEPGVGGRTWLAIPLGLLFIGAGLALFRCLNGLCLGGEAPDPEAKRTGSRRRASVAELRQRLRDEPSRTFYAFLSAAGFCLILAYTAGKMMDRDKEQTEIDARLEQTEGVLGEASVVARSQAFVGKTFGPFTYSFSADPHPRIMFEPVVEYHFDIDGQRYRWHRIGYTLPRYETWEEAQQQIDRLRKQPVLRVYYDRDNPLNAVLDPRYEENRTHWFFLMVVAGAVISGGLAIWFASALSATAMVIFRSVSFPLMIALGLLVVSDLAIRLYYLPVTKRLVHSQGFVTRMGAYGSFPLAIQVTASYQVPGTDEFLEAGQWRLGHNRVWSHDAGYAVEQRYPSGQSHDLWIDPKNPSLAVLSPQVGSVLDPAWLGICAALGVLTACLRIFFRNSQERSSPLPNSGAASY